MKIKTLIIGSLLIAGILTGCNGQSATTTAETQTTTEIESTAEVESTTTEPESTTEVESTTSETEPAPEESTNSNVEADITGVDGTVAEGDYDELDHPETKSVITDDVIDDIVDDILGKPSGGGNDSSNYIPEGWAVLDEDALGPDGPQDLGPGDPRFAGGEIDH